MHRCALPVAALLFTTSALIAQAAPQVTITEIKAPELPLGKATYEGGKTLDLNVGIGSAAFRAADDAPGIVWMLTDRGPNLDCKGIEEIAGLGADKLCAGDESAKNFPLPGFVPAIYKVEIGADNVAKIVSTLPLKGKSGKTITGLPFSSDKLKLEAAYNLKGALIPGDPSGIDSEAIVKLADGTFIVGEEYGSSLVEVAADGTITRRLVPKGQETGYQGADYEIVGALPAIIAKRQLNRGIENVALSPDGAFLYVLIQSPLANPDSDAYKKSAAVRLWKIDRASGLPVAEYLYVMDDPTSFASDNAVKPQKQNDVRLSEMVAIGPDKLLVLERINKSARIYKIDLVGAAPLPAEFDDAATSPSLEQLSAADIEAKGLKGLIKTLVVNSDDIGGLPKKIEGVAVISPTEMIVVNDSDFGIEGDKNVIRRLTFSEPVLQ